MIDQRAGTMFVPKQMTFKRESTHGSGLEEASPPPPLLRLEDGETRLTISSFPPPPHLAKITLYERQSANRN